GRPVLEKYDANQTLAWRNVLDSLSNVPEQAANLSVTQTPLGSGVVLGMNTTSDRKLSYYFFSADGKVAQAKSVQSATSNRIMPIRPVSYNKNEMLFGFNQPDDEYTPPTFYRLRIDSTTVVQQKAEQPSFNNLLYNTVPYSPHPPVSELSLPLFTDGKTAYAIFNGSYKQADPSSGATTFGYALANFTYRATSFQGPKDEPSIQRVSTLQTDLAPVAGSMSYLLDNRGNLFTTQAVSTSSATDLIINKYDFNSTRLINSVYDTDMLYLLNSTKVGTVSLSSADASRTINRLVLLKSNVDGSLLISGTTTGTMTIGKKAFIGTLDAPAQFLITIAAEAPNQSLSVQQIKWASSLPTGVRKVFSNARQQSWVQLADSTFRYYNLQGKLGWEKKLPVEGIRDAGVDVRGNLYTVGNDAIYAFDSTGSNIWQLSYKPKGQSFGVGRLAVRPGGGGVFIEQKNSGTILTEFDEKGNLLISKDFFRADSYYWTPNGSPVQLNNLIVFSLNYLFLRSMGGVGTYLINYNGPTGDNGEMASFTGPAVWQGADSSKIYLVTKTFVGIPYGLANYRNYSLSTLNFTNKGVANEVNTPRVNAIGLAKARAVNPAGTLFTLQTNSQAETATTTSYNLVLNEYLPSLNLRNTTQLGTFTLVNGQTDQTSWELVQAYADGSLLLSGITSGTLTIGNNTYMGSPASPTRFLTLINTTLAQVTTTTTTVCTGTSALIAVKGRYKGYIAQPPVVELYSSALNRIQTVSVPFTTTMVVDTTVSVSLPIATSVTAGVYRLRTVVGALVSDWVNVTLTATPASLSASQQAGEVVATGTALTYQWYDAQRNPITAATAARFRPMKSGSYYVTGSVDGCTSDPSNTVNYVVPNITQLIAAPTVAVCTGTTIAVSGRYQGYFVQRPVIQLSDASGSFTATQTSVSVPLPLSATTTESLTIVSSVAIPAGLPAGTYGLRVSSTAPETIASVVALSVVATPVTPTAKQEGDELVGVASAGSYQWFDAQNKPITNATDSRYKPQTAGSYYVVSTVNGCTSAASAPIVFVITATEPAIVVEVYPNPAADRLLVRWPGAAAQARIRLLTAQGRVVQEVARQGEVTVVSTQNLASGLVLVQLQAEGQPTQVRKVLIQR
ncbi:MAG TPA: T9SS type A sorting domain-containing protein, partial [Fibrella sp.]